MSKGFSEYYRRLLENVKILDLKEVVNKDAKERVSRNSDVAVWLEKIGFSTRPHYTTSLCYFLKCVGIGDPTRLLDLKVHENVRTRFFPAERLVETWLSLAKRHGFSAALVKKTLDAVRSFYKFSRVPLVQVSCSYKPRPKPSVSDEELRRFREGFNWYGKVLFDFFLSIPLRDGQFQICPNCGELFYPRWQNITTFPVVDVYSPFLIRPAKGHESNRYPDGLMQVCYLTETAAKSLNMLRDLKEKELGRKLKADEFIFTHQKSCHGTKHVTPIGKMDIVSIFQGAQRKSDVQLSPHRLRSWVNSVLASRGIEKQLRDLYLGHSCAYEMGYVMQLLSKWQHSFREARAMEYLDITAGVISPYDLEDKLLVIDEQRREIDGLKVRLASSLIAPEDMEALRMLLDKFREGKVKISL